MLVTNVSKAVRGFHDKQGRVVMLKPGEERNIELDSGTQSLLERMSDGYKLSGAPSRPARAAQILQASALAVDLSAPESLPSNRKARAAELVTMVESNGISYDALLAETRDFFGDDWPFPVKSPRKKAIVEELRKLSC